MYEVTAWYNDKDETIEYYIAKDVRLSKGVIMYVHDEEDAELYIYLPNTYNVKVKRIKEVK